MRYKLQNVMEILLIGNPKDFDALSALITYVREGSPRVIAKNAVEGEWSWEDLLRHLDINYAEQHQTAAPRGDSVRAEYINILL